MTLNARFFRAALMMSIPLNINQYRVARYFLVFRSFECLCWLLQFTSGAKCGSQSRFKVQLKRNNAWMKSRWLKRKTPTRQVGLQLRAEKRVMNSIHSYLDHHKSQQTKDSKFIGLNSSASTHLWFDNLLTKSFLLLSKIWAHHEYETVWCLHVSILSRFPEPCSHCPSVRFRL